MVFVKNWPFFQTFYFRQYRPGKSVLRYSRSEKAFVAIKSRSSRKLKNWHFSKVLVHGFGQNVENFQSFYFS